MGELAAERLVATLAGESGVPRQQDLGFEIIVRETT
jgi:DNA-binding LacI/PurR family transcriptional regulator